MTALSYYDQHRSTKYNMGILTPLLTMLSTEDSIYVMKPFYMLSSEDSISDDTNYINTCAIY